MSQSSNCIYLDWNATTPLYDEVADTIKQHLTTFGNPSSTHAFGRPAASTIQTARQQVADMIHAASPSEIHFCSCGTEADKWAIWGTIMAARKQQQSLPSSSTTTTEFTPHVITSSIEHPAILEHLKQLASFGLLTYTTVPVDSQGFVSLNDIEQAIKPQETVLITIMHSNNEIGTIQPIADIAKIAPKHGIKMHTDAAQSCGKVPIDVQALGVDFCSVVGHKFGAPKGVAALYIKNGVKIERLLCGGGQEGGQRAGTENTLHIAAMGTAAAIVTRELPALQTHYKNLRKRLYDNLAQGLDNITPATASSSVSFKVNGPLVEKDDEEGEPPKALPNTLSISIKGVSASLLLTNLAESVAASAGAACHSQEQQQAASSSSNISSVLAAIGLPVEYAMGTLRLSVGRYTTESDVDIASQLLLGEIQKQLDVDGKITI